MFLVIISFYILEYVNTHSDTATRVYLLILSFIFEFGRCIAKSVSWFRFSITHIPPTLQTSCDSSFYIWIQTLFSNLCDSTVAFHDCVFYIWIQPLRCNVCFLVSIFTSLTYLLCFTPRVIFISIFGFRQYNLDYVYWFCFSIIHTSHTLHISRDSWFLYLDLDTTHCPFLVLNCKP